MVPYGIMEELVKQRMRQMEEEAKNAWMLEEHAPRRASLQQRVAVSLALFLIAAGVLIQKHYDTAAAPQIEPDCSTC